MASPAESVFAYVVEVVVSIDDTIATTGITMESDLYKDLGLDSLSRMDLLSDVERHYKITIADEQIASLTSVSALVAAVHGAVEDGRA